MPRANGFRILPMKLIKKTKKRSKKPAKEKKATFISDCNDQYIKALTDNFEEETIKYGQPVKERKGGRIVHRHEESYLVIWSMVI